MMTVIRLLLIAVLFICFYLWIKRATKNYHASKNLEEIYNRRIFIEERRLRLIAEKPEYVIFLSQLRELGATIRFIGMYDSLEEIKAEEYDYASVGYSNHLFKDGKWYEIVDDMTGNLKMCYYGIRLE